MPTYEYECANCGENLEIFQSITEKPLKKCPSCGKRTLRRLIGAGGALIFKGSGFYATDYRSDTYKKKAKEESGSGAGEKGKGSSPEKPSGKSDEKKSGSAEKK
jgi:putative FmdB family regulatory protein